MKTPTYENHLDKIEKRRIPLVQYLSVLFTCISEDFRIPSVKNVARTRKFELKPFGCKCVFFRPFRAIL